MLTIFLLLLLITVSPLDIQRQLQFQNTLNYLIELSKADQLHNFNQDHYKKCVSLECCICSEQFKSSKASAIHYALYHRPQIKQPQAISVFFDEDVPSSQRYQFCLEYMASITNQQTRVMQEVCTVLAWNMHRSQAWIQIIKYVLYVLVGFVTVIFCSDIAKPWK